MKKFVQQHHKKIIIGAPILFFFLMGTGIIGEGNIFLLKSKEGLFFSKGDAVSISFELEAKTSINALAATVEFPNEVLKVISLTREGSIVDLWAEEPTYSNEEGKVEFAGGIINRTEGELEGKSGTVIHLNFQALNSGVANLSIINGELLANDGKATQVLSKVENLTVYVREQGQPSPDINEDGKLSWSDVNALYFKTFRAYDQRYDMNNDGALDWTDVKAVLSLF